MPRFLALMCLGTVLTTSLAGCATAPPTQAKPIDYAQRSYKGTRFEKPGLSLPLQTASFRADVDDCETMAERNYQNSIANRAKLSQLYGHEITPQLLQASKQMQVVVCMSGMKNTGDQGKGWIAAQ